MSNNAGWTIMDWIDPETWKLPAALVEYWKTVLVGAVAIVGAVGTILRWGLKPIRWAWSKMVEKVRRRPAAESGSQTTAETRPLRFVEEERRCFWTRAQKGTSEGTQVAGHWHVTNTTESNIVLLKARLDGHQADFTNVVTRDPKGQVFGSRHPILARRMSEIAVSFMFFPPIIDGSAPLVADIVFTDNYENEHRVRAVTFKRIG